MEEEKLMPRSRNYQDMLIEALKDPKEALGYLNAILEECQDCDEKEAQKLLLSALNNIAQAQGGITKLSKKSGLGRESLYKTLSPKGNPKLTTLTNVIHAMGFDLKFCMPSKR